jgi:hypothetical protein
MPLPRSHMLCAAEKGYIGLVQKSATKGDYVIVLLGGPPLMLPRNNRMAYNAVDEQETYQVVGHGYFLDPMNGEALKENIFAVRDLLVRRVY